ncbi:MAG: Gfo/Idh/MocA family oxidoreductase [Eubacteriales bacterium]|nr:Gfo/Idh/MocA family oxidoreductase [Eubacteriales bacterium]
MLSTVRTGVAGLGSRGFGLVKDLLMDLQGVEIVAVCDDFGDRAEKAQAAVREKTGKTPRAYRSYDEMLDAGDLDAVLVITPWETHVPFAIHAMEKGIPVGIEVGGATSVQECWDLVRTYEKTRTPFMFLENCCFGRTEMMVTHMVRQGLFGEIVHCAGAYAHDLRDEVAGGNENHHYRLRHYRNRNCENYPTHELGPIAKLLNVNSGNRMLSLTSMASKAAGMNAFGVEGKFNQGDVVTTLIRCAGGETIQLSLDTTLPRYYCRDFTVRGTKGMYEERTNSVYLDGMGHHFDWNAGHWNNADSYRETYEHPLWQKFISDGVTGGHGGMDGLVYGAFFRCLQKGWPMPLDVYDAAAWMAITPLSEQSIALGSAPVEIPDFTSGRWLASADSIDEYVKRYC